MKRTNINIKTRVLVAFLFIGLIPAVSLALYALHKTSNSLAYEAESKLAGVSQYKMRMITDLIEARSKDIHRVPLTPMYVEAAKTFQSGTAAEKQKAREQLVGEWKVNNRLNNYFHEVRVLDLQGNHLASLRGTDLNEAGNTWFQKAMENAKHTHKGGQCEDLYISPIEFCNELGMPTVHMAHVIRDRKTFKPIAMYAASLNLETVQSLLSENTGLGKTGQTYLVGPDLLARSNLRGSDTPTILQATINTDGVNGVFANCKSTETAQQCASQTYLGPNGQTVLAHNQYIPAIDSALIAEIDQEEAMSAITALQTVTVWVAVFGIPAIILFAMLFARTISNPINGMTSAMHSLAGGDLQTNVPEQNRADEIGRMANAVQVFKDNAIRIKHMEVEQDAQKKRAEQERCAAMVGLAEDFEGSVGHIIQAVTSAATELQASASQMQSTAQDTSMQSTAVATASEEAASNIQTVASAVEELAASTQEISQQVQRSTNVSESAVDVAEETSIAMQTLSTSVSQIGEIIGLIDDIAAQTNLLALNATIEAARAGDAGKGFAVVANEVKNLATQTSRATGEISSRIMEVQSGTKHAVEAIDSVTGVIRDMRDISTTIASAVEEQTAATSEIAQNLEQASVGAAQASRSFVLVDQAANETGAAASQIQASATELSEQAEVLREKVSSFLDQVRQDNNEQKV